MIEKSANISPCGTYRYYLAREWDRERPTCCFIMLNPSTADATVDDPTIRRCIGFAKSWCFGKVVVLNLFAYRATDPKALGCGDLFVGPMNDEWLRVNGSTADLVVAAWGAHPIAKARVDDVLRLIPRPLMCLGRTKDGSPRHPLYVPADTMPVLYAAPWTPGGTTQ